MFCPFPLSFPDTVADGSVVCSLSPLKEASRPLRWPKTMNRWDLGSCLFQVCPSSQGLPSASVSPTHPCPSVYSKACCNSDRPNKEKGLHGPSGPLRLLGPAPCEQESGYLLSSHWNEQLRFSHSPLLCLLHRHRLAQLPVSRPIRMLILPFAIRALNFRWCIDIDT